jgi:hypothetical protein
VVDDSLIVEYGPLVRHRAEVAEQRRRRRLLLAVALPATLAAVGLTAQFSATLAMLVGAVAGLFLFFLTLPGASSVDPGALSGVEGEVAVLKALQALPADYLVLNRVRLPDPTLPNGERELDFIVAGPTGLWVVEVKNTPGIIHVTPKEKHWPLVKRAGCGSSPCWNAVANPLPQVRAQVEALTRWFLVHGHLIEPRAAVVFAHPETGLESAEASAIPICLRDTLVDTILASDLAPVPDRHRLALGRLRRGGG